MKKHLLLLLAIFLTFTACQTRLPEEFSESVSSTASEPSAGSFDTPFPVTDLQGGSLDTFMEQLPLTADYNDTPLEGCLNTPPVLYLKVSGHVTLLAYDKATGNFSSACRDPLCDHETCLWRSSDSFLYRGRDGLFFLMEEDAGQTVYQTDFFGNDPQILFSSSDRISHLVQEDGYLYYLSESVEEETRAIIGTVFRYDLQSGKKEQMASCEDLCYFMPLGGKLLYLTEVGYQIYNPVDGTTANFGDPEMSQLLACGEYLYYHKQDGHYRKGEYGMGPEEHLSEEGISQLLFGKDCVYYYGPDNVIYKASLDFKNVEVLYRPDAESRISNVAIHGNLLHYAYHTGTGASRKHHFVFVDLLSGKDLKVTV